MEMILLGIGALIAVCVIAVLMKKKPKNTDETVVTQTARETVSIPTESVQEPEPESVAEPEADYSQSYQAKYLLTRNEWYEYKKLKKYAAAKDLQVCPKVRLLDFVEPRKGAEHYKSLFYKIQAKHVDFLICDQDLHIKAVVELDDNSHNKADRQERDRFVDQVLTSCGYKVIRTRAVTEETLNGIN